MSDLDAIVDTDFRAAVSRLDRAGRLTKVDAELDRKLEVAGFMRRMDGGRALLFERVRDATMPILGNFLASPRNVEAAFGLSRHGLRELMLRALGTPVPTRVVEDGPAQEVVITSDIDLGLLLPVLEHAPGDAGSFITAGVVVARHPDTGIRNASYHRLQLLGGNRTAIKLDFGRHLRSAFEAAAARGERLPIAVCIGTDLGLTYAAAFMGSQMPESADEFEAAGALRGRPLELVACRTQPLEVPTHTEIVLEGEILADETVHEGPFGEFIGYLSDAGPAPVVRFTAVTMRSNPIYHAINGAGRETITLRKYVLEAAAMAALRDASPIARDVELTAGGLYRFHLVVSVHKGSPQHEGFQRNAMLVAFGALKDLDLVTVVDDDIDISDPSDVEYAIATRMEASRDLIVIPGARGHEYVRVSNGGIRAKLGIDATVPFTERDRFTRLVPASVEVTENCLIDTPGAAELSWLSERRS